MASTTATWNTLGSPPSLAAMSVGDTKTVTGKYATLRRLSNEAKRKQGGYTTAKKFGVRVTAPLTVVVTRKV